MPLTQFTKVASVDDVPDGEMISVLAEGERICLAHIGDEFFAINDVCTHFFTLLSDGWLFDDKLQVQCPLHDSRFSLETGEPHQAPAEKPVEAYAVQVEGDDLLVGPKD